LKAVTCALLGSMDALKVLEVPLPKPAAGEVRVDVKAASLNFMDVLKIRGGYQVKPSLPFTPGDEFAGVVSELGPDVRGVALGDRVAALASGAFAEEAVVQAARLVHLPDTMSFRDASAFFVVYGTSLRALKTCAHLERGEVLLVLGGAGGVGLAAIEVGKAMGAKVIAAASSAEKRAACLRAGATVAIDYERLREQCYELTDRRGIDVVFDPVGGSLTEAAFRSMGWRGRLVVVGFASGTVPSIAMNLPLLKERTITGVYLGGSIERDPKSNSENYELLKAWYADSTIRPVITAEVSLEEVPAALTRLERREVVGKIVVLPEQ
jgi:NADPH2:quinone reductase